MKYKINLFPPPEQTLLDKLIYFSFHYLRYILVLTQLVVLGVFTYRFSVDQEIVDLKDTLQQKQEIVELSKPLIQQVTSVDYKTKSIRTILNQQQTFQSMLEYYLSRYPAKINASKLSIENDTIVLEGIGDDVASVQNFYSRIKSENKFKTVEMSNIRKLESGYAFTFTLKGYSN